MKNVIICENCSTENSFYLHICSNCGSFLRTKVENIDFWSTAWNLFTSPIEVFEKIIYAKHKNYIFILPLLISLKYFITISFIRNILDKNNLNASDYMINIIISLFTVILLSVVIAASIKVLLVAFKIKTRFKDNLSILFYAFIPMLFGLIFLFPVNYAVFGPKYFTFYPSPFLLNYNTALILSLIDGLMTIWTLFLLICGIRVQSNSWLFGTITGILTFAVFAAAALFSPFFL